MKSFSPAGMATKGLFGYSRDRTTFQAGLGAQSFGNPSGATRGGGAYPAGGDNPNGPNQGGGGGGPVALFTPQAGTLFNSGGDFVQDVAILDSAHAVVVSANGFAGFSSDGGNTWGAVPIGLGIITANQVVVSPGGVYVLQGSDGTIEHLARSVDNGHTWTDVTPGSTMGGGVFYSPVGNVFVAWDITLPLVWTSVDGATWTSHATPNIAGFGANGTVNVLAIAGGNIVITGSGGGGGGPMAMYSADGINWLQGGPQPGFLVSYTAVATDGTVFSIQGTGGGDTWFYQAPVSLAGDPTNYTLQSQAFNFSQPPYSITAAYFPPRGLWVTAFNFNDFATIATSPDGVTWSDVTVPAPGNVIGTVGTDFYSYGGGIQMSTDLVTFTPALVLTSGSVSVIRESQGLTLAVGQDDAFNGQIWKKN